MIELKNKYYVERIDLVGKILRSKVSKLNKRQRVIYNYAKLLIIQDLVDTEFNEFYFRNILHKVYYVLFMMLNEIEENSFNK